MVLTNAEKQARHRAKLEIKLQVAQEIIALYGHMREYEIMVSKRYEEKGLGEFKTRFKEKA